MVVGKKEWSRVRSDKTYTKVHRKERGALVGKERMVERIDELETDMCDLAKGLYKYIKGTKEDMDSLRASILEIQEKMDIFKRGL